MRYTLNLLTFVLIIILIVVGLVIVFTPDKCEHENTIMLYSFASYDSTAHSDYRPYCRDCETAFNYTLFQGTPTDQSYLEALVEQSDASEIIPGEYYTVTAVVTLASYNSMGKPSINCKVENENYIVGFNVEFREGFAEAVSYKLLEEGSTITFRGRFYDEGCGFTDCELISK